MKNESLDLGKSDQFDALLDSADKCLKYWENDQSDELGFELRKLLKACSKACDRHNQDQKTIAKLELFMKRVLMKANTKQEQKAPKATPAEIDEIFGEGFNT